MHGRLIVALLAAVLVAGCDFGAREVDYTAQRGYSADIAASLNRGPTSAKPGMAGTEEPIGALPWEIGESRQ